MFEALPPDPPAIVGRATVIDGDTLEIAGQRIRLWGIDAPEGRQTCTIEGEPWDCGQASTSVLRELVDEVGGDVSCIAKGRPDRYRRIVAQCRIVDRDGQGAGWDLAEHQVLFGLALDYPRYSGGAYREAEESAQRMRNGMWVGEFQAPWQWRAR